jgi:phage gpG-like protein
VRITLEFAGVTLLDRRLLRIAEQAQDLTAAFDTVANVMQELADLQFSTEGALSGGWEPLKDSTEERKSDMSTILTDSGALRESLSGPDGTEGAVRRSMADGLDFGTTIPYAAFHQHGTSRMAKRPVLALREEDKRRVVSVLHEHIFGGE